MPTIPSDSRLRQIAILVASVDAATARHLLVHLPTEIAKKVRAMAAEIGPVPHDERRALMQELQKSSTSGLVSKLEQPGWSSDELLDIKETSLDDPLRHAPAWTRLSTDALLRFVRHERPTVIAVILHQLPPKQSVAVLQRLPRSLSREVLRCLGSLQDIDPVAMQAIDEHLSERLSEYRHKIENDLENTRRINELLAASPADMRHQWASWIYPHAGSVEEPMTAEHSTGVETQSPPTSIHEPLAPPGQTSRKTVDPVRNYARHAEAESNFPVPRTTKIEGVQAELPMTIPFQPRGRSEIRPAVHHAPSTDWASSVDRSWQQLDFDKILTLYPEQLARLLSGLDPQTVLLALAGATTQFMRRFSAMLEPADAKVLNDRLQKIGPIQLRDVDEAQRRVIQAYWSIIRPAPLRSAA